MDRFNNKRLSEEVMTLLRGFSHTLRLTSGLSAPVQTEIESEQSNKTGTSSQQPLRIPMFLGMSEMRQCVDQL